MVQSGSTVRVGVLAIGLTLSCLAIAGCSQSASTDDSANQSAAVAPAAEPAAAPPAPPAGAPATDNVDTLTGATLAQFTGDAAKGETAFIACKACHAIEEGVNKIGPSLKGIVGRKAGTIAGFTYTPVNQNSGITWTPEKLFQYLESPQRVVPGTKMAFAGISEPQKRADVIAYLKANP